MFRGRGWFRLWVLDHASNHREPLEEVLTVWGPLKAVGVVVTGEVRDLMLPTLPQEAAGYVVYQPAKCYECGRTVPTVKPAELLLREAPALQGHIQFVQARDTGKS